MKNFVLIGVAGYIAPRHLEAIKNTGNNLLAAIDKNDSVGILDKYFPEAQFFTEFERFDRHCEKLKRNNTTIDYVVVCSPNYLHDAHIRFGLRLGADVICEKPIVLNPWNIDALSTLQQETNKQVFTILQLRLYPQMLALKTNIEQSANSHHIVELQYISARGNWYHNSWKGDITKSGGIATNIGIHFFDILIWLFGTVQLSKVTELTTTKATGTLQFANATVTWLLSISAADLPQATQQLGALTYRNLTVNGHSIEFSDGLSNLHTNCYYNILQGQGVTLGECKPVIELVHQIRNSKV